MPQSYHAFLHHLMANLYQQEHFAQSRQVGSYDGMGEAWKNVPYVPNVAHTEHRVDTHSGGV